VKRWTLQTIIGMVILGRTALAVGQDEALVSVGGETTPLATILQQIADQGGLVVEYDPEAIRETTVTLARLTDIAASSALKLVCQAAHCRLTQTERGWKVEPEGPAEADPLGAARELMEDKDYAGARDALRAILRQDAANVEALLLMCEVYFRAGLGRLAAEYCDALRRLDLKDPRQLAAVDVAEGRIKESAGRLDEALAAYTSAIARDPDCAQAYALRATSLDRQGEHEKATSDWEAYLAREPVGDMAQRARLGCVKIEERTLGQRGYWPTWSPDGKEIAFALGVGGWWNQEVRTIAPATGASRVLVPAGPGAKQTLDWSADGKFIAWESRLEDWETTKRVTLGVVDVTTGEVGGVDADYQINYPRWHPDGKEILVYALSRPHLLETIPWGLDEPRLAFRPLKGPTYAYGDWSPDSKHLVVSWNPGGYSNYALYLTDVQDPAKEHQPLTLSDDSDRRMAAFSPDGRAIAYRRALEPDLHGLWAIAADGSSEEIELAPCTGKPEVVHAFSWSPDGREIACEVGEAHELRILRLGGLIRPPQPPA
jgi:tetratricopeptide (TPR) repeat protein